jgi:ribosomal protein L11 methyltransferase
VPNASSRLWHAVEVVADAELADAVGAFLLERGAPGLQTEERGDAVAVTAHFEAPLVENDLEEFFDELADIFPDAARPTARYSTIEETQWAENWKTHFPPLAIGERLFVHPPWVTEVPAGRVAVELDPGMAFGTGQHGSTRGCLAALEALVTPAAAPRLLDLGTGSGILAIAAVKLGARAALAVDIDPLACEIAAVNAAANGVAAHIEVAPRLAAPRGDFDIVVANLFSGMLIGYAADIARRLSPGGHAIGAGLLSAEAQDVAAAWAEAGMEKVREYEIEGWTTLVFRN